MPMLKNYDQYLQKLKNFSKALKVKIDHKEHPGGGIYMPSKRKIIVDPTLSESAEIACFLHELGHFLDDCMMTEKAYKKVCNAYEKFYGNKANEVQKTVVVASEIRAWVYGRAIARILGIKVGKWYTREQLSSIKSYRKS